MIVLNPQPVDMIGNDCERLPVGDVAELQSLFNVNTSEDEWFDEEIPIAYVNVVDEEEFFQRYFGE